jgi:hypothetical protein
MQSLVDVGLKLTHARVESRHADEEGNGQEEKLLHNTWGERDWRTDAVKVQTVDPPLNGVFSPRASSIGFILLGFILLGFILHRRSGVFAGPGVRGFRCSGMQVFACPGVYVLRCLPWGVMDRVKRDA